MKSVVLIIIASLSWIAPTAARYGLLRVDSGPVSRSLLDNKKSHNYDATANKLAGTTRRVLMEEDFNLLFRQLFGGVNHGVGHSGKRDLFSGSMSMSMSMSMVPEWGDSSSAAYDMPPPVPTTTEPSVTLVDYPTLPTADEAEDTSTTPSGEEGSAAVESSGAASSTTAETLAGTKTGREKAMFGVLSLALVGLVGAALARRKLKQRHAGVAGHSDTSSSLSPSSDASMMDDHMVENGRMMS